MAGCKVSEDKQITHVIHHLNITEHEIVLKIKIRDVRSRNMITIKYK